MTLKNKITFSILGVLLLLALTIIGVLSRSAERAGASVSQTDEYIATTTSATYGIPKVKVFKVCANGAFCPTVLGSVIVTETGAANTGHINFYNATTSNVSMRAAQHSTSTILIASIPNNLAAGTYTFDVMAPIGLIAVYDGLGTVATTTITYR